MRDFVIAVHLVSGIGWAQSNGIFLCIPGCIWAVNWLI